MPQIPYADSHGTLSVEVNLKHAADVFLVDSTNFQKYKNGQQFKYYGGHYSSYIFFDGKNLLLASFF